MKKIAFIVVAGLCLSILAIGGSSLAQTWSGDKEIPAEGMFNITLPGLTTGEDLTWDWYTEAGNLHFWIENETDYIEYEVMSDSSDTNDLTIPEDGPYEVWWENPIPAASGIWNITLTYTVQVINHDPTASASSNKSSGKEPLHVKFTGSGNDDDGTIEDYEWDFGDGSATSSQMNPTHVFPTHGEYTVELTVTDNDGNTDTDTIVITVNENPAPTAVAATNVSGGEPPLAVSFDSSGSSDDTEGVIVSYHWDFEDGNESTEPNPTHTFAAEGTYDVILTVTDNQGATDQDTVRITVSIINLAPTAAASADKTSLPEDQTVTFTDASTDADGTIAAWAWDFGDSTTSTDQNPTHTYDTAGTYTVVLVVADDDDATDTISISITVLADSDGDGYEDSVDEFPDDATEWEDTDDDGIGDNADPDDDNDGMSDDYENIYEGLDPKVDDADADPDGDGATNIEEHDAGTNPVDVGSKPTEEEDDFMSTAGGLIILIIIIILVVILLLFLMRKGGGKPKGAPPEEPSEEMGEEEPVEEYGDEEPVDVDEEPSEEIGEVGEEPAGETSDEELDELIENTEEEKPEF